MHFNLFSTIGKNRIIRAIYADEHFENIGASFEGYLRDYRKKPRSLKKAVSKLVSGVEDQRERAAKLLAYVSSVVAVDTSELDLRPARKSIKDLLKKKNGRPFEANILLTESLRLAGIDAWPVLIATRDRIDFRRSAQFNHMIAGAKINGEMIFLDVLTQGCPIDHLRPDCCSGEGLLVDYDRSYILPVDAETCEGDRVMKGL